MPSGSTIQEFVNDLRDRKSNITRALDRLFKENPGRHKTSTETTVKEAVDWLRNPGSSPYPLNQAARLILRGLGVSPRELDHIDNWRPGEKKKALDRIAHAIDRSEPNEFFWELYEGNDEVTDDSKSGIIVFRSPRKRVRVEPTPTGDQIRVDVGS